ncbi:heavy-metal-associated domain-containing protein [Lentiprolixibacter aurantiacus]|uniref:Heavy-metal-associated domain-containing protein n=1 Tax=Lentiprolixibacter aurantiacus TaxID=2993939 RepID=A0AAE3SPY1_9FLAO|nr:heavy-metal-associated domain-containing protein [Lentiprolixibacter aurantiacus]MCX2719927.1 heavy-metal-associated domain-containing protein [Lentiprolixibacter aurantiacus]
MSLLSDHIIPGDSGKIFTTNASEEKDLKRIKRVVMAVEGVHDVLIVKEVFPREFIVHTRKLVAISDIENAVKLTGFHVIPKGIFTWQSQEPK